MKPAGGPSFHSDDTLTFTDIEFNALTGGKIELNVNVKHIKAKVVQGSDIILYGKSETQHVSANTAGNYLAVNLECNDSYVKSQAGSIVKVVARRLLDANATTKGFIGYKGLPESLYDKSSVGGEIKHYEDSDM